MRKPLSIILALLSTAALGGNNIFVKDNSDVALTLANNNYNRIVVQNDKIMEAVFPPNSMVIKRDEQDGSVYVMLSTTNPFTLFLTTEAGRHFSVSMNGEESLGKTIELIPQKTMASKASRNSFKTTKKIAKDTVPEAILAMLNRMEQRKPFADIKVARQFGKAERWSKGLALLPKEIWSSKHLNGEIIVLYNGGKEPLKLSQEWFAKKETLAVKFSKSFIAPGEKAMLYRIQGADHG